jgi:hypothetical protein
MNNQERLDKALKLLKDIIINDFDIDWQRDYFNVMKSHVVRTEHGWIDAKFLNSPHFKFEILEEINKPEGMIEEEF